MKNSRSHLLMKKKKIALPASKALITSYFLNIKGFLGSPFYFRCFSYMSGQSLYYAHVLSFSYCGLQISWDIWYGGSEGSDDLLFSLILLPWNISATMFFHLPPLSGTMLFIFFDDYLELKKTNFKEIYIYLTNGLLSKSVQVWSLSLSKAWAEAYNGSGFLEEKAFSLCQSFLWYLKTQLYNKELT